MRRFIGAVALIMFSQGVLAAPVYCGDTVVCQSVRSFYSCNMHGGYYFTQKDKVNRNHSLGVYHLVEVRHDTEDHLYGVTCHYSREFSVDDIVFFNRDLKPDFRSQNWGSEAYHFRGCNAHGDGKNCPLL